MSFNPNQARAPKGSPIGGQWVAEDSDIFVDGGVHDLASESKSARDAIESSDRADELKESIRKYTRGDFRGLNDALRNAEESGTEPYLTADQKKLLADLQELEQIVGPAEAERYLMRGIQGYYRIPGPKIGLAPEELFDKQAELLEKWFPVGAEVKPGAGGFASTSTKYEPVLDASSGDNFLPGPIFLIKTKKGVAIDWVSSFDDESEVLLSPKHRFRVARIRRGVQIRTDISEHKRNVIELEDL